MTCKPCAERRKKWLAKKQEKRDKGNKIQAAAIGAALAATDLASKALGLAEVGEASKDENERREGTP